MTELCSVTYCGIELAFLFAVVVAVVVAALWFAETLSDRQCEKHRHPLSVSRVVAGGFEESCRCGKRRKFINWG